MTALSLWLTLTQSFATIAGKLDDASSLRMSRITLVTCTSGRTKSSKSRLLVGRGSVFRFVLFLLGNRAPPRPAAALLIGLGLLPTSKKRRDAWDAMRGFRDGTLRIDAFYWSLEAGSRQDINAPGSWCAHGVPDDMRDPTFWADAQRMLRCQ